MVNPSKLLALLEKSFDSTKEEGKQNTNDTLMAGLSWESHYWIDCAIDWIEQGCVVTPEAIEKLKAITLDKSQPQQTRHRASSIVRRWQRERST